MITAARQRNLLLEQAIEAIVPVLGVYSGGTVNTLPDVEGAIDRASQSFADRISARWQDWLKNKSSQDLLQLFTALTNLNADDARQEAANVLDRHLLDVRPEDRSFALDYVAGIPAQVKQVLVYDRLSASYHLPPDWSLESIDALQRFLPAAGELKRAWARGGAKSPGTPQLQREPDAPRTVLPALATPAALPVAHAARALHTSAVVTKLRLLAQCHRLLQRAWWKRVLVALLLLPVCIALSIALGVAVYWSISDNPQRHVQRYQHWDGSVDYYVRGKKASQQEHDYFLATNSNDIASNIAAGSAGIGLFILTYGTGLWLVLRPRAAAKVGLEEQIQAIIAAHPEEVKTWGGPSVLYHHGLVEELLRLHGEPGMAAPPQALPASG